MKNYPYLIPAPTHPHANTPGVLRRVHVPALASLPCCCVQQRHAAALERGPVCGVAGG